MLIAFVFLGVYIGQSRIQKIINNAGLKRKYIYKKKRKKRNRRYMYIVPNKYKMNIEGLVYFDVKHIRLTGGKKAY